MSSPHPQLEEVTAVVARFLEPDSRGGVTLFIDGPLVFALGLVTIPRRIDRDGYGKMEFIDESLLLLPAYAGTTNGDVARWLKQQKVVPLDRSEELRGNTEVGGAGRRCAGC